MFLDVFACFPNRDWLGSTPTSRIFNLRSEQHLCHRLIVNGRLTLALFFRCQFLTKSCDDGNHGCSVLEQFLQSKRQGTPSTKRQVALSRPQGITYGIPDCSCRRIDDGALRADHSGLFETARMVTANGDEDVISVKTLSTALSKEETMRP